MVITAVIDRFEDGNAVLLSEGIEICVPASMIEGIYKEGDTVSLILTGKEDYHESR